MLAVLSLEKRSCHHPDCRRGILPQVYARKEQAITVHRARWEHMFPVQRWYLSRDCFYCLYHYCGRGCEYRGPMDLSVPAIRVFVELLLLREALFVTLATFAER